MSKLRSKKTLAAASAALVVAGGGGAAIALAQGSGPSPQAFFDSVAKHLGVSSEELEDATKAAALEQVDAVLAAGKITQEEADALKSRIESGEFPFFGPGFFGPRFFGPEPFGGFHHDEHVFVEPFTAAAAYLGLSVEELRERLGDGRSLAEIAQAEGKSVDGLKEAMVADAKNKLAEAVSDERLTQKEADAILERLEARIDDLVDNTFEDRPGGPPGFGLLGPGHHFSAAAAYLGLTVEELRERLGDGRSLADVAQAEGKSVDGLKEAIVADAKKELAEAVSEERLTQDEADAILERLEARIDELVDTTFRVWRRGDGLFGPGFGPDPNSGAFWEGAAA